MDKTIKSELEEDEEFGPIDFESTKDVRTNQSAYNKLNAEGFVVTGTIIESGDVIISKFKRLTKSQNDEKKFSDQSVMYKGETAVVSNVIMAENADKTKFIKVTLRIMRYPDVMDRPCLRDNIYINVFCPLKKIKAIPIKKLTLETKIAILRRASINFCKPTEIQYFDYVDENLYQFKADYCRHKKCKCIVEDDHHHKNIYKFETTITANHKCWIKLPGSIVYEAVMAKYIPDDYVEFRGSSKVKYKIHGRHNRNIIKYTGRMVCITVPGALFWYREYSDSRYLSIWTCGG